VLDLSNVLFHFFTRVRFVPLQSSVPQKEMDKCGVSSRHSCMASARSSMANAKIVTIELRDYLPVDGRCGAFIKYAITHDINTYSPQDRSVAFAWVFFPQYEAYKGFSRLLSPLHPVYRRNPLKCSIIMGEGSWMPRGRARRNGADNDWPEL
jgi:hypothetical protein